MTVSPICLFQLVRTRSHTALRFAATEASHDGQRRTLFPLLSRKSVSALESTMEMAASMSMKGVEEKMDQVGKDSITIDAVDLTGETSSELAALQSH
jgi:cytochrome P450